MQKAFALLSIMVILSGCKSQNRELERMMAFRASLLSGMGCSFQAVVTADYGEELYRFTLDCRCDEQGNLQFSVVEPESISGISGTISGEGAKLKFDNDTALAFEPLTDGQVTPVTSSWMLVKTLRGGYVTACTTEENLMRVSIDDSFQEKALRFDIWFSEEDIPQHAELLWENRRILSLDVTNFEIL